MNFRKKPVVIEAFQFDGSSTGASKIKQWMKTGEIPQLGGISTRDLGAELNIDTMEGVMTASAGDWIIKGVEGEFYPCKPDIFDKTYDPEGSVEMNSDMLASMSFEEAIMYHLDMLSVGYDEVLVKDISMKCFNHIGGAIDNGKIDFSGDS